MEFADNVNSLPLIADTVSDVVLNEPEVKNPLADSSIRYWLRPLLAE